ncbi:efflux transporter outer membrane subunit [Novosphingobium sp.]|uniref:efflux transporter outer membrane subunit n=1 Tax=Novosphingobium sp. TaxID=1874826 RepID=UPI0025E673F8|nr:efflux transporter outer membrane subunit [Novosphingobium sp.]
MQSASRLSSGALFRAKRGLLMAVPAVLVLSACAPDLGTRPQPLSSAQLESARSLASGATAAAWPVDRWWQSYADPQLDALVDEALAHSPDVAAATARIRQARGLARQAGAAALPQLGAGGSAGVNEQSRNFGIPPQFVPSGFRDTAEADLNGSFDLDLWGKNKAQLAAATSDAKAAEIDARQAALMLSAQVVSTYGELARQTRDAQTLQEALTARDANARLVRQRRAAGLDSELPVRQADTAVASARFDLSRTQEQIAATRHALAALLGAGPDRGLAIQPPTIAPAGTITLPADAGIALAGRRPDIVAARLRVEASGRRTDAARAAFLPDISLSGLIGFTSLGITNLFAGASQYGNARAAISLPIFDGGRRAGNLTQARGGYDEAVARYDSTVIAALREVADAVSAREQALVQISSAARSLADADVASALANQRYRAGLSNYLEVLSASDRALAARRADSDARFRLFALDVSLARALGGGFSDTISLSRALPDNTTGLSAR